MEGLFTKKFRVAGHEVGPGGEVLPSTLLDYLQEVAGEHAATWKLSVSDLLPLGRTWVLSRYHLHFCRYPSWGEELLVTTWPSARNSSFAVRDFMVDDAQGRPVVRASSTWVMLDLSTKKPMHLDGIVPAEYAVPRRALETDFERLPPLVDVEQEASFPVMLRDLDINVHVNHVVYVQWALETIPLPVLLGYHLASIEVAYRAEARRGDDVLSRRGAATPTSTSTSTLSYLHTIVQRATGTELTRLRTTWQPREKPLVV
jgi:acyl-ACP thioesterase